MKFVTLIFNITLTEETGELGFILIAFALGGVLNYLIVLPFLFIIKKESYIENFRNKKGPGFIFLILLGIIFIMRLASFTSFYNIGVFPDFSTTFFAVTCLLVSIYNAKKGIEGISRSSVILLPLLVFSLFVISLLILGNGIENSSKIALSDNFLKGTLNQMIYTSATSFDGVFLFLLAPYIDKRDKIHKKYIFWLLGYVLFLVFMTFAILLSYGKYSGNLNFIYFISARNTGLGTFIERFEAIHVALWVLCVIPFFSAIMVMMQDIIKKKGILSLFIIGAVFTTLNFFLTFKYTYLYNIFINRIFNIIIGALIIILPYTILIFGRRKRK